MNMSFRPFKIVRYLFRVLKTNYILKEKKKIGRDVK